MTQRETLPALSAYFHQYIRARIPIATKTTSTTTAEANKLINRSYTSKHVQRTTIDLGNTAGTSTFTRTHTHTHTHMSIVWLVFNIDWRRNCRLLLTFHTNRQTRAASASSVDIRQKQQRLSSARLRPGNECKGLLSSSSTQFTSEHTNHINWTGRLCRMVWHFTLLSLFASWKV